MIIENSYPVTIDTGSDHAEHDSGTCGDCGFLDFVEIGCLEFASGRCLLFREPLDQGMPENPFPFLRCARCLDVYEKKE